MDVNYGATFASQIFLPKRGCFTRVLKTIQGVSRYTRTCVALSLIGVTSLEVQIHKGEGIIFGQLDRLDTYFAVKQPFLYRLTSKFLRKTEDTIFPIITQLGYFLDAQGQVTKIRIHPRYYVFPPYLQFQKGSDQ